MEPVPNLQPPLTSGVSYETMQVSDAGTDVLILTIISTLETQLFNRELTDEGQVRHVVDTLRELHGIRLVGDGLHFVLHATAMALGESWDHKGGKDTKDAFGRTQMDPTKEAQTSRAKIDFLREELT